MSFCAETEKYKIASIILLKSGKISVVLRPPQDVDVLTVRRNPVVLHSHWINAIF